MMLCDRLEGTLVADAGQIHLGDKQFHVIDSVLARGGRPLIDLLHTNVDEGSKRVDALVQQVLQDGQSHSEVLYRLAGATTDVSTPMEYGGHFLERDREILSELTKASCVILYVQGSAGVFLDFVSDLPAELFGWNAAGTGVDLDTVRQMRAGLLACDDPRADVQLDATVIDALERMTVG